ncbi:DUF945 family protein [Acinetobacter sp. WCHA55]|uniref:DUF945 family protein n=1 Tax=Acinetobacter sp. WCHA55 TaxID=2004646 RepID=UPI000B3CB347|nr:DUF945 family protein [Acinetobacter sp. WCHA55]AYA68291.1 DUF945 family protein [Acinetobacter sp. WCHA55]
MSQLKWGVGGVLTLAVVAVGGNLYADKSLKAYYQQGSKQSNNLNLQYQQFQMGALKGSAKWSAELVPDPCKPKDVVKLSGQDNIQRSWNGYAIQSDIKITQAPGALQSLLKEPLKVDTKVNWLGTMNSVLTTPVIIRNEAQLQSRLDPMTLKFRAKPIEQQLKILDLRLEIPNLTVTDPNMHLQMVGLKLESNQGLNGEYLEAGESKIQMDLLKISDRDINKPTNAELKNFSIETQSELTDRVVNTEMLLRLDEMKMPSAPTVQNVQFNFNVLDVNRQKLQMLFDIFAKSENSCLAKEAMEKDMEPALLAVINEGFRFESKENQFAIGEGVAQASVTGRIMPSHQSTMMGMVKMMPSLMEYKADVQFDKNMISSIMNNYLHKGGISMSDQEIETMLSTMQNSGQVKREGNTMKMSVEYKYGQTNFLKE